MVVARVKMGFLFSLFFLKRERYSVKRNLWFALWCSLWQSLTLRNAGREGIGALCVVIRSSYGSQTRLFWIPSLHHHAGFMKLFFLIMTVSGKSYHLIQDLSYACRQWENLYRIWRGAVLLFELTNKRLCGYSVKHASTYRTKKWNCLVDFYCLYSGRCCWLRVRTVCQFKLNCLIKSQIVRKML